MDIEKAKETCKAYINAIDTFGTINYKCINNLYEPIDAVLSELEKKDKEIEKLKKDNKELLRKLRNRDKEVNKLTKYSLYKKEFSTLNKQLEKKDKIIDLIVEDFQNDGYLKGMSREEILDYYQERLWLKKQRNPLPLKLDIVG